MWFNGIVWIINNVSRVSDTWGNTWTSEVSLKGTLTAHSLADNCLERIEIC